MPEGNPITDRLTNGPQYLRDVKVVPAVAVTARGINEDRTPTNYERIKRGLLRKRAINALQKDLGLPEYEKGKMVY